MIQSLEKSKKSFVYRVLCAFIAFTFASSLVVPPSVLAQGNPVVLNLPAPGTVVSPTIAFNPVNLTGIRIHPQDPLKLNFIVNRGDESLADEALRTESNKIIKYFLAALTVPESEMWVNLSPYEENRIVADGLGRTEMGRDLLAQDYMLKQLTSSLMHPDKGVGKEFWKRVKKQAYDKFGTTDIPLNTFNKIWILPERAVVFENDNGAFVVDSHLKVMLEEDYFALEQSQAMHKHVAADKEVLTGISLEVVREVLLPAIEQEVNNGKTFVQLRQIYNAMILATWYKDNLKESFLGQEYVDKSKTGGIESADQTINTQIYNQYVESLNQGVYDFIQEDYEPTTQQIIPRKYFSGGMDAAGLSEIDNVVNESGIDAATRSRFDSIDAAEIAVDLSLEQDELNPLDPAAAAPIREIKRIGILTNGGPASGHNEVIATVVEEAARQGITVVPVWEGYNGLIKEDLVDRSKEQSISVDEAGYIVVDDVIVPRSQGGSAITASRANPYKRDADGNLVTDEAERMWAGIQALELDALFTLGGDDTQSVAYELQKDHPDFPVVGLPKTMDNDINLPDIKQTYGFDSFTRAATVAAQSVTTAAKSTKAIMVMESFGRAAGWAPLRIGANIEAARTIIPEEGPIDLQKLVEDIKAYYQANQYAVLVVSEGVSIDENLGNNAELLAKAFAKDPVAEAAFRNEKLELDPHGNPKLKDAGRIITAVLAANMDAKVRQAGNLDYAFREADVSEDDCLMCNTLGKAAVDNLVRGRGGLIVYLGTDDQVRAIELPSPDKIGNRFVDVEGANREEFLQANQALSLADAARTGNVVVPTKISVIAQRIVRADKANTGELNGRAAIRAGANSSLAGHSEARQNLGDTDEMVADQLALAHELGLEEKLFAFGEPLEVREQGIDAVKDYVRNQIAIGLSQIDDIQIQDTIFAYEPIWAIGTGKTATAEQAQEMAQFVRETVRDLVIEEDIADSVRILYGGSVTEDTAAELIAQSDIDGFLVGGASNQVVDIVPLIEIVEAQGPTSGRIPYVGGNNKTKVIEDQFYEYIADQLADIDFDRVQVGFAPSVGLITEAADAFADAAEISMLVDNEGVQVGTIEQIDAYTVKAKPLNADVYKDRAREEKFYASLLDALHKQVTETGRMVHVTTDDQTAFETFLKGSDNNYQDIQGVVGMEAEFELNGLKGKRQKLGNDQTRIFRLEMNQGEGTPTTVATVRDLGRADRSVRIIPKKTVMLYGFGTISGKIAYELVKLGVNVIAANRTPRNEQKGAGTAVDMGVPVLPLNQSGVDAYEKAGFEIYRDDNGNPISADELLAGVDGYDTIDHIIEGLDGKQEVVVDKDGIPLMEDSKVVKQLSSELENEGYKLKKVTNSYVYKLEVFDNYDARVLYQGSNKPEQVSEGRVSETGALSLASLGYEQYLDKDCFGPSCNTTSLMGVVMNVLLDEGVKDNSVDMEVLTIRRTSDTGQAKSQITASGFSGWAYEYHHAEDVLAFLEQTFPEGVDLLKKLKRTPEGSEKEFRFTTNATAGPQSRFHVGIMTIDTEREDGKNMAIELKKRLAQYERVALVETDAEKFQPEDVMGIMQDRFQVAHLYLTPVSVKAGADGKVRLIFMTPQESNVIPNNVSSLMLQAGLVEPGADGVKVAFHEANRLVRADLNKEKLQTILPDSDVADAAATPVGGIDLDRALMNLEIKTNGKGIQFPAYTPSAPINFNGIVPVIINVTPVTSLPLLLGIADEIPEEEPTVISYNLSKAVLQE